MRHEDESAPLEARLAGLGFQEKTTHEIDFSLMKTTDGLVDITWAKDSAERGYIDRDALRLPERRIFVEAVKSGNNPEHEGHKDYLGEAIADLRKHEGIPTALQMGSKEILLPETSRLGLNPDHIRKLLPVAAKIVGVPESQLRLPTIAELLYLDLTDKPSTRTPEVFMEWSGEEFHQGSDHLGNLILQKTEDSKQVYWWFNNSSRLALNPHVGFRLIVDPTSTFSPEH